MHHEMLLHEAIVIMTFCSIFFFSYDGKVEHYRVRRDGRNWVTVDDEEYFENLVKLVEVRLVAIVTCTYCGMLSKDSGFSSVSS